MRRTALLAAGLAAALIAPGAAVHADDWHAEQPQPPAGTAIGVPVPLGAVGDVEFWAPNRGLLTTAGNDGVPAGLYAYDGTGWHQLSTVCGGHDGRIAWAAPNEWWTIADQPAGQIFSGPSDQAWHRSLCHFVDGRVVASYAEPIGTPTSYLPLDAAACNGPSDCWFGGDRLPGTGNAGAFHLHWDGQTLTAVPSLTELQPDVADPPRAVASLAVHQGALYESVQVSADDPPLATESADQPTLLHQIDGSSSNPFFNLLAPVEYPSGVDPWDLSALRLTSDGAQLWAIGGAIGDAAADVVALRLGADGQFAPVPLDDAAGTLPTGTAVADAAAEPGSDAAWVAYVPPADRVGDTPPARLVRIHADGTVEQPLTLPGPGDGIARKGRAGPVACPAPGDCWMATSQGWLFHLGGPQPQDDDPILHQLITFRPPDDSIPFVPPDAPPIDDSGANLPPDQTPSPGEDPPIGRTRRAKPLVFAIRSKTVHGTTLVLSFKLRARARVQLVARRHGRVVAHSAQQRMAAGPHRIRLRLDPKRWPTKLDLRAHPVKRGTR
jgi:hypothetical protein